MSIWQQLDIENKIVQILKDLSDAAPEHHLGNPFLTAYQIAIEFAQRFPNETARLNFRLTARGQGNIPA